jgi:hypothetical protein
MKISPEDKKYLLFGGLLIFVAVVVAWLYNRQQTATASPSSVPQNLDGTYPASYPSAGSAVPGVDISTGAVPTYLTYNLPQSASILPSSPNGATGPLATAGGPTINIGGNSNGGCCDECADTPQLLTYSQLVDQYGANSQADLANLQATGLTN